MGNLIVGLKQANWLVSSALGILAVLSLSFGNLAVAEEDKKKKTRRVPAISQSLYKQISEAQIMICLLYTSPSPRDGLLSRMPSSA